MHLGGGVLSVAHPIWDNISGAGNVPVGGSQDSRVKKASLWLCENFCKIFGVNPFCMYQCVNE